MQLKSHKHNLTLQSLDNEIQYYKDFFQKANESQLNNNIYIEEINTLKYVLEELERENIDLEQDCFQYSTGVDSKNEGLSHINNIVEELKEKKKNEEEKHRKNTLYIKKEYDKSISEEVQEITGLIERVDEKIKKELEKIAQYEQLDMELLENISLVSRQIKEKLINHN